MIMSIVLELPIETERRLRAEFPCLELAANEAVALDLLRKEKITHHELGLMLGLDRRQTEAFLMERLEFAQCLTLEDVEIDRVTIKRVLGELGR
jgi:hypothetical protein